MHDPKESSMHIAVLVQELAVFTTSGEHMGQALLGQLREAVWGNSGKTMSGASSANRTPLVVDAFTLWEDIDGQIQAMFHGATEQRPNRSPEVNLLAWWAVFSAAAAQDQTTLLMHEVAAEKLESFSARIIAYFNRPTEKDLDVACPACGLVRVTTGEGEEQVENFALTVTVRPGKDLVVVCRSCKTKWVGDTEVINLGRQVGVELDVDAIREARIPIVEEAV